MDLTRIFNDAALGSGRGAVSEDGSPRRPIAPASQHASAPLETQNEDGTIAKPSEVEASAVMPHAPDNEIKPAANDNAKRIALARAEMERLEAGRATPSPEHELKPPPKWEQIVNTNTERYRESQIAMLQAFLDYAEEQKAAQYREMQIEFDELDLPW